MYKSRKIKRKKKKKATKKSKWVVDKGRYPSKKRRKAKRASCMGETRKRVIPAKRFFSPSIKTKKVINKTTLMYKCNQGIPLSPPIPA